MNGRPSVSVALATYNGARFLREQLDSLLAQTHPAAEIVVCDDGSGDGTWELIEEYRAAHPDLFRILRNPERLGYIRNFERAVSLCSGEFIALCDQDDLWMPEKLERLLIALGSKDLVHSDARLIDSQGELIAPSYASYAGKAVRNRSFRRLLHKNAVTGCTLMLRGEFGKRAIPFPSGISHDWWLALLAADRGRLVYCGEALTAYRQHGGNALGAKSADTDTQAATGNFLESQDRRNKRLLDRYADLAAAAEGRLSKRHAAAVRRLAAYYAAYFDSSLRLGDFWYHMTHFLSFSGGMDAGRALKRLALSALGRRLLAAGGGRR